jgi:hypothetical protein
MPKKTTKKVAKKAPAKKAVKKTAKKAPVKKAAKKAPAKKAAKKAPPKAKAKAKKVTAPKPAPTAEEISHAAYLNYVSRQEQGIHGDEQGDWLAAEESAKKDK